MLAFPLRPIPNSRPLRPRRNGEGSTLTRHTSEQVLELLEALLHSLPQRLVPRLEFVARAGDVDEKLYHAVPVAHVDVLGGDFLFARVHVVVVAKGDADGAGGEAVDVVD